MDKKYHKQYGLFNNQIGFINYWQFKNGYIFLNFEKVEVEPINDINQVTILSEDEYDKLYKERNIHEGNEREKEYGKIHEGILNVFQDGTTEKTGRWSFEFCQELAFTKANIDFLKEIDKDGFTGGLSDVGPEYKDIFLKYHISPDCVYMDYCDKMMNEEVSEEEILEIMSEYNALPEERKFLNKKAEGGLDSKEIQQYIK